MLQIVRFGNIGGVANSVALAVNYAFTVLDSRSIRPCTCLYFIESPALPV